MDEWMDGEVDGWMDGRMDDASLIKTHDAPSPHAHSASQFSFSKTSSLLATPVLDMAIDRASKKM